MELVLTQIFESLIILAAITPVTAARLRTIPALLSSRPVESLPLLEHALPIVAGSLSAGRRWRHVTQTRLLLTVPIRWWRPRRWLLGFLRSSAVSRWRSCRWWRHIQLVRCLDLLGTMS